MATKPHRSVKNLIKSMSLKELRKVKGVSLKDTRKKIEKLTGEHLRLKDVRAIEDGRDESILKLAAYVEALGGVLEMHTTIPVTNRTLAKK
jgi:hypothetical protein